MSGNWCLAGVPLACSSRCTREVTASLSSDQPDDEFPASEQSMAGLADDDFVHLPALLPILHWGLMYPGHHHLEVGDGSLGGGGVLKCRFYHSSGIVRPTDQKTTVTENIIGQEATVRTRHGTTNWFKLGKESIKAEYCHLAYLTYMQSTSCEMLDWMNHKLES